MRLIQRQSSSSKALNTAVRFACRRFWILLDDDGRYYKDPTGKRILCLLEVVVAHKRNFIIAHLHIDGDFDYCNPSTTEVGEYSGWKILAYPETFKAGVAALCLLARPPK